MAIQKKSKAWELSREDLRSVAVGAAVAMSGAGLTYASQWASSVDFGEWTPLVVAVLSVAANALRKWAAGTR